MGEHFRFDLSKIGRVFAICVGITNFHIMRHPLRKIDKKYYQSWRKRRLVDNLKECKKQGIGLKMLQTDKDLSFNSEDSSLLFSDLSEEKEDMYELSDVEDEEENKVVNELNKYRAPLVGCSSNDDDESDSESESESDSDNKRSKSDNKRKDDGNDNEKPPAKRKRTSPRNKKANDGDANDKSAEDGDDNASMTSI